LEKGSPKNTLPGVDKKNRLSQCLDFGCKCMAVFTNLPTDLLRTFIAVVELGGH